MCVTAHVTINMFLLEEQVLAEMQCFLYGRFFVTYWSDVSEQQELILLTQARSQLSGRTRPKGIHMLQLLGTVVGLLFIIMCFSKGLKEGNKPQKTPQLEPSGSNKKKDLSEEDVHLLAQILSVGLVDADPNYLHHLKGYRDLQAA